LELEDTPSAACTSGASVVVLGSSAFFPGLRAGRIPPVALIIKSDEAEGLARELAAET